VTRRCPVCAAPLGDRWASAVDIEYETTADRFDYLLCGSCDLLAIDPVPSERLSEIYPPDYYSFAGGADELGGGTGLVAGIVARTKAALDRRTFWRVLAFAGTPSPRILDVGGGTGEISATLVATAGRGATATVVDFDPDSTAVAARRGLGVATCRFEEFETDARYDVILMLNLIEHVEDPIGTMRRAGELLTSNGVVWIQTPNFRALDARIFRHRNWAGFHCPRHWAIFSRVGLERALGRAQLEPLWLRPTQAGAFWAASILGILRRRQPGRRGRPLVRDPFFAPLAACGAGFDFVTAPFRAASQVVCVARLRDGGR
jgi:SAM-dependent methyltransferase